MTNKNTGAVTDLSYSGDDEVTELTRGYGTASATTEHRAYDAAGSLLSVTDGNGHVTTYGYDSEGNRTSMVDPNKHETKWGYDSKHDVTSLTTPKGEKTTIKRDSHGNAEVIEQEVLNRRMGGTGPTRGCERRPGRSRSPTRSPTPALAPRPGNIPVRHSSQWNSGF